MDGVEMQDKPTMMTYIKETPEQVKKNLGRIDELVGSLVDAYVGGNYRKVWIVACGSSNNSSQCAKPFMTKYLKQDVQVIPSNSFVYYKHEVAEDDFVMVISQSGCSTNSIEALDKLRSMGRLAIGLTANLDSDFKDHSDLLVDYGAGEEKVGYVTKGVVTLVLFLVLFALRASKRLGLISAEEEAAVLSELSEVPERHEAMQTSANAFYEAHKGVFTSMSVVYSCGFVEGYGIACEAALKMGETIKVPSFAFEAEEYIHGPNLQLTPNYTAFFIDDMLPGSSERLIQIWHATSAVSDKAFAVTNSDKVDDAHAVRVPFEVREPLLLPLYVLPLFQIVAYRASADLNSWDNHPLFGGFRERVTYKTESIKRIMPIG